MGLKHQLDSFTLTAMLVVEVRGSSEGCAGEVSCS